MLRYDTIRLEDTYTHAIVTHKQRQLCYSSPQKYLDQHKDLIASGISHCGRLDQYLGNFAAEKVPRVISSDELDRFFSASSLEEQAALFKSWPEDRVQELIRWECSDYVATVMV